MSVANVVVVARRSILTGHVQGVGLRPAAARLARRLGISGTVRNVPGGVEIHVEGEAPRIAEFQRLLPLSLPRQARLAPIRWESCVPCGVDDFQIVESDLDGPLRTEVPPDLATCRFCIQEAASESDRRTGYAFTNCTDCGPRYSIIDAMPFDRGRTSMRPFSPCANCDEEYADADDRRFHAQTNACPECGPALWLAQSPRADSLWEHAAEALCAGTILAVRGLGGYQLVVDATSAEAVRRLRRRKRRPSKPLAVMVKSMDDAEALASLTDRQREWLDGPERPILLVPAKRRNSLCAEIHPGIREVGLFLPTTVLHWLLLDHVRRPLVVTSGNVEGEPLSVTPAQAERELAEVADLWLHHDRDVVRPIDDSVLRQIADRPVTIRCARGQAPTSLEHVDEFVRRQVSPLLGTRRPDAFPPPILALGAHQKGAIALFNGVQAVLGPHLGDLDSLRSRERFVEHVNRMKDLYRCRPQLLVHDAHPDYFTTCWAQSLDCRTLSVQHHHAHVVSGMTENGWLDREVLGVAFDGTGYGTDGTIWGGEFLRTTVDDFERVGHLRPFRLPGGESAIRQPWRVAASLLVDAVGEPDARRVLEAIGVADVEATAVIGLIENERLSPITSSAGRLFDGTAAIVLGLTSADDEGRPAMLLESAADPSITAAYEFTTRDGKPFQVDWRRPLRQLLGDRDAGLPLEVMAAKFHNGLACAIADVCLRFELPIVLTGGVFQNRLLTERVVDALAGSGRPLGLHQRIPPNDGGLAAGQLAIGLARLARISSGRPGVSEGGR